MSVYFYEPSYNWDRFWDQAFGTGGFPFNQRQQRLGSSTENNEVQRFLKPK
jgi:HSP20 family protein